MRCVALNWLSLVHHALELGLLELEVLLLEHCLLARLCRCFVLAVSSGEDEALIGVDVRGDVVVIQMLCMVLFEMGPATLIWRGN